MPKYARVLVDDSDGKAFDYELPEAVAGLIQPGSRVRVPVRTRTLLATVIELLDHTEVTGVKLISEVVSAEPILSPLLLRLGAWMADYYCCSLEQAMKAVLPNVIRKAEVGHQLRLFASLAREITEDDKVALEKKAPIQAATIAFLSNANQPVALAELSQKCAANHAVIQALIKKGLILTVSTTVERDPHQSETFLPAGKLEMNPEQLAVFARVCAAIEHSPPQKSPTSQPLEPLPPAPKPILLHGVTGSGKTEIYLQSIQLVLDRGQTAIMLVPEISLTPQTVERFKSRFASTQHEVAVLHSHLSEGERHDEWHKIRTGRARIIIGARSAIFAPCSNLGLIVVDEEHENTYKQENVPRYHGRDVAVLRAAFEPCAIVLGSATPSLESWNNTLTHKYQLVGLTERAADA
ncbi:MAG: primosomal protein N', partial [Verrucomicrobia bacterium]|nr:primosomal protein N' [Verrucomicrobiota bacterium]